MPSVRRGRGVCVEARGDPFSQWPNTIVSAIDSMVGVDDASNKGSHSFTLPIFALPWVQRWLPFPLGFSPQLHTLPLPATHVGLATGLHTNQDSFFRITQTMRLSGRNPPKGPDGKPLVAKSLFLNK